MDGDLHLKAFAAPLLEHLLVLGSEKSDLLRRGRGREDISERHVLEALRLTDVVVVGDVDPSRDAPRRERHNIERREVWPEESVLLEIFGPWQHRNELCRLVHKRLEFGALGPVHYSHKPLELPTHTEGVPVRLDEADVGLDRRPLVLDPGPLGVLVVLDCPPLESCNIALHHLSLVLSVLGHILNRLLQIRCQLGHEGCMVSILNIDVGVLVEMRSRGLHFSTGNDQVQHFAFRTFRLEQTSVVCLIAKVL
mmetsp:Transcript_51811/g.105468  ORF Transcript_51811/g.105468 Transcript_51811/m.105468 type:complete len:252 (+) Transcript_51811:1082-1837(+)